MYPILSLYGVNISILLYVHTFKNGNHKSKFLDHFIAILRIYFCMNLKCAYGSVMMRTMPYLIKFDLLNGWYFDVKTVKT